MKRALGLLLCVLLSLSLPLSALAQSAGPSWLDWAWGHGRQIVSTVTVSPGEGLSQVPALADLCEALSVEIIGQKGGFATLSVLASGQEALSCALRTEEAGVYAQSQAVSDDILFFVWEDMEKGLRKLQDQGVEMNLLLSSFDSLRDLLLGNLPYDFIAPPKFNQEEWEKYLVQIYGDDEAAIQRSHDFWDRVVRTQGDFTGPDHDPATEKIEMLFTEKDILFAIHTSAATKNLKAEYAAFDPSLTEEQLNAEVEEFIAHTQEAFEKTAIRIPITLLTSGEDVVSLSMPITLTAATEESPAYFFDSVTLALPISYRRLTTGEVKTHGFQMEASEGNRRLFGMDAVVVERSDGWEFRVKLDDSSNIHITVKGRWAESGPDTAFTLTVVDNGKDVFKTDMTARTGDEESQADVKLSLGAGMMDPLPLTGQASSGSPSIGRLQHLLTLHVRSAAQDADDRFADLAEATPASSTQFLLMTPEEQADYGNLVNARYAGALAWFVSLLPASVREVLLSPGGY